jgi:hypothetical protein
MAYTNEQVIKAMEKLQEKNTERVCSPTEIAQEINGFNSVDSWGVCKRLKIMQKLGIVERVPYGKKGIAGRWRLTR